MAKRGMGAATSGGGCVAKGAKDKTMKSTSKTTGPIFMADGGDVSPRKRMAMGMKDGGKAKKMNMGGYASDMPMKDGGDVKKMNMGGGVFSKMGPRARKTFAAAVAKAPVKDEMPAKGILSKLGNKAPGVLTRAVSNAAAQNEMPRGGILSKLLGAGRNTIKSALGGVNQNRGMGTVGIRGRRIVGKPVLAPDGSPLTMKERMAKASSPTVAMKKGGSVKKMKKGGLASKLMDAARKNMSVSGATAQNPKPSRGLFSKLISESRRKMPVSPAPDGEAPRGPFRGLFRKGFNKAVGSINQEDIPTTAMKKGGSVKKMHKMPDGSMMLDSDMGKSLKKMKKSPKKMKNGGRC